MTVKVILRESGETFTVIDCVERIATRIYPGSSNDDVQLVIYRKHFGHPFCVRFFDFVIEN